MNDRFVNDETPHDKNVVNEDNITHSLANENPCLEFESVVMMEK